MNLSLTTNQSVDVINMASHLISLHNPRKSYLDTILLLSAEYSEALFLASVPLTPFDHPRSIQYEQASPQPQLDPLVRLINKVTF